MVHGGRRLAALAALALPACHREDRVSFVGDVTWSATFDEEARAAGARDCTYTRHYEASEDRTAPWLCPRCDLQVSARVTVDPADLDCYASVTGTTPQAAERLGISGDQLHRGTYAFAPMSAFGALDGELNVEGHAAQLVAPTGTVTVTARGGFQEGKEHGDPWQGLLPPDGDYACGWPRSDREPWEGPWKVRIGKPVPDGWFGDTCEEGVRLHDLLGEWMVIDVSALDCAPCQAMAEGEKAFVEDLRASGVEVRVVTLLAPSLATALDPTPTELLEQWTATFDLEGPVLGDRGWGYTMGSAAFADMAYPSWFLVAPDGEVVDAGQGFGDWDVVQRAIEDQL